MAHTPIRLTVIALDLERTLIDNALSGRPRPGVFDFVEFCLDQFERVVLFTTVDEPDALDVLNQLADLRAIPPLLLEVLEYVNWSGEFKDIAFVPGAVPGQVVLVDDDEGWMRPDQRDNWVSVSGWDGDPSDRELWRVRTELERRLTERT